MCQHHVTRPIAAGTRISARRRLALCTLPAPPMCCCWPTLRPSYRYLSSCAGSFCAAWIQLFLRPCPSCDEATTCVVRLLFGNDMIADLENGNFCAGKMTVECCGLPLVEEHIVGCMRQLDATCINLSACDRLVVNWCGSRAASVARRSLSAHVA